MYEKEPASNFLNEQFLYRAVPKVLWNNWDDIDEIEPAFFMLNNAIEGLSIDWSKYSKASESLARRNESRGLDKQDLSYYGMLELNIGDYRKVNSEDNLELDLQHDPRLDNRAHSLIHGIMKVNVSKVRMLLSEVAKWALDLKPKNKDE